MKKITILKHKIIRAYNNPENQEYSEFKGYPEGTYFGYKTLNDCIRSTVRDFRKFYGNGLRKWHYGRF